MSEPRWIHELIARARLPGEPDPVDTSAAPPWATRLRAAVSRAEVTLPRGLAEHDQASPFSAVWAPLIATVCGALASHATAGSAHHVATIAGVTRWMRLTLASLGLHVLMREFTSYRNGVSGCLGSSGAYRGFVAELRRGGLVAVCLRNPIWARMIGSRLDHTIRATRRFLDHWTRDRDALTRTFPGVTRAPPLDVQLGLSDPHAGGRTVIRVRFADGEALYYKPRRLAGQRILHDLNTRLHAAMREPPPVSPRILERDDHGWVAHVRHCHARSRAEWTTYHRRAGVLLFALYLCGATDAHADNIIAHGTSPVLIDTECLFHPTWIDAIARGDDSVARTGLLPRWTRDADGRWYSQAGLSDPRPFEPRRPCWEVVNCNTDAMTRRRGWTRGNSGSNTPWRALDAPPGADRGADVSNGFARAYRAYLGDPDDITEMLRTRARAFRGRFVARSTARYIALVERLTHPTHPAVSSRGASTRAARESLMRPFVAASPEVRDGAARLVDSELRQLVGADIPLFYSDARRDVLVTPDGAPIHGLLERSALAALERRIARLGGADLEHQRAIIRDAFLPPPSGLADRDAPRRDCSKNIPRAHPRAPSAEARR